MSKLEKLRDEFLNRAATKIDKCPECGFHSLTKLEDAWDACLIALRAEVPAFDDNALFDAATDFVVKTVPFEDDPRELAIIAGSFETGARWQHQQMAAQVAALKAQHTEMMNDITDMRGRLEEFRVEALTKDTEIERLQSEVARLIKNGAP